MTNFARVPVIPGPVLEIFSGEKLFPMHPSLASTWFEAPEGVDQNYVFDGKEFSIPVINVDGVNAPAELSATPYSAASNIPVLKELAVFDTKKIRAITDALLTGDLSRLRNLESEAAVLRSQLIR